MEAWQATLLGVAIRIVYDSGRDLVKEILERRRAAAPSEDQSEIAQLSEKLSTKEPDAILHSEVMEKQVSKHSEYIEHLTRLFEIYQRNYQNAKEKSAMWGAALVPPIVLHELEDAEKNLVDVLEKLRSAVNSTLEGS
jgi:hypothetical protein